MAVEQIELRDFQAHNQLTVDLSPGVTTVVGPSDAGKSAILRALWWVLTNQPGGESFIRDGAKLAQVRVYLDGGRSIHRLRSSGGRNEYILDGKEKYVSFGAGVPDAVAKLANVGPVCFQSQHDAPFWFAETAGQVSRNLNSIVDLGVIDESLGAAAGRVQRARDRAEQAEEMLTQAVRTRDGLAWVDRANTLAGICTAKGEAVKSAQWQVAKLATAVQAARTTAYRKETAGATWAGALAVLRAMSAAGQAGQQAAKVAVAVQAAQQVAQAVQRRVPDLSKVSQALADLDRVQRAAAALAGPAAAARRAAEQYHQPVPDTTALDAAYTALHAARVSLGAIRLALDNCNAAKFKMTGAAGMLAQAKAELETKSEGTCPLCGSHVES